MKNHRTRFIITLIAVIIVAVVGYFWYQQSQIGSYGHREIVTYVDRGLTQEHRTKILEQIEEEKQAIADAEKSEDSSVISNILQVGNLYYRLGELATSIEYYDQILADYPADAPALENKGQSLYEMGDYEGAEANWHKALETNQYEVTYIRLAKLYNKKLTDKQADIKPLIETAITNLGQEKSLLIILGHWYRDNGFIDEAISHYKIVLQLDPDNQDIAAEISKLQGQKNKELQLKLDE